MAITFDASPRLIELLDELDSHVGSLSLYTPLFGYDRKVERGEIKQGDPQVIDVGNSGTTIRLMTGWLAGQGGFYRALEQMGRAQVEELVALLQEQIPWRALTGFEGDDG